MSRIQTHKVRRDGSHLVLLYYKTAQLFFGASLKEKKKIPILKIRIGEVNKRKNKAKKGKKNTGATITSL